jgi:hypothetical protein
MSTVRLVASLLYRLTRLAAIALFLIVVYASTIVLWHQANATAALPIHVTENGSFQIFFPFTTKPFLLGDYTTSFLISNLVTLVFYACFLWLLGSVFKAFRQTKLFTPTGVLQLSRFYLLNLLVPLLFLGLLLIFGKEIIDIVRIILLHLVIGVFAFFMAAIFKQGLVLQEEQDLTF